MLDSVHRIDGPVPVMEHQRQPLHVVEQPGPEVPNQLLACIGLKPPGREVLDADQERDSKQDPYSRLQGCTSAAQQGNGVQQPGWQRLGAENAVHNYFERQWIQKGERQREKAKSSYAEKVQPATPRLLEHTKQNGFFPQ